MLTSNGLAAPWEHQGRSRWTTHHSVSFHPDRGEIPEHEAVWGDGCEYTAERA
jgi:hypothetical protein